MKKIQFQLSVSIDEKTGDPLAVYFGIRKGQVAETVEFEDGKANADYDKNGNLLGIELLAPCDLKLFDKLSKDEPTAVKEFFQKSSPRGMVLI